MINYGKTRIHTEVKRKEKRKKVILTQRRKERKEKLKAVGKMK